MLLHLGALGLQLLASPLQLPDLSVVESATLLKLGDRPLQLPIPALGRCELPLEGLISSVELVILVDELAVGIGPDLVIVEGRSVETEGAELEVLERGGFVVRGDCSEFGVVHVGAGPALIQQLARRGSTDVAAAVLLVGIPAFPLGGHVHEFEGRLRLPLASFLHHLYLNVHNR